MSLPGRFRDTDDEDNDERLRERRGEYAKKARAGQHVHPLDLDDEFDAPLEPANEHGDYDDTPSPRSLLGSDYLPLGDGGYIRRRHLPAE
jgi:hypothetical protein